MIKTGRRKSGGGNGLHAGAKSGNELEVKSDLQTQAEHLRDMKQFSVSANVRWSGSALGLNFFEFSVADSKALLLKVKAAWQNAVELSTESGTEAKSTKHQPPSLREIPKKIKGCIEFRFIAGFHAEFGLELGH